MKLEEVANSATCVADTSQTSTSFSIEETTSFDSLLNISADEEVLSEATKTLLDPAPHPNAWRARQKKKQRRLRPQISIESAESEIEVPSGACVPPSGAQAKSQEDSTPMLDFDRRAIIFTRLSHSVNIVQGPDIVQSERMHSVIIRTTGADTSYISHA